MDNMISMQSLIDETEKIGFQRGYKEGIQYGIKHSFAKGIHNGKIKIIMVQLMKILGNFPPDIKLKLESCDEEKLENLALHIFDVHSINDVLKYIK